MTGEGVQEDPIMRVRPVGAGIARQRPQDPRGSTERGGADQLPL